MFTVSRDFPGRLTKLDLIKWFLIISLKKTSKLRRFKWLHCSFQNNIFIDKTNYLSFVFQIVARVRQHNNTVVG